MSWLKRILVFIGGIFSLWSMPYLWRFVHLVPSLDDMALDRGDQVIALVALVLLAVAWVVGFWATIWSLSPNLCESFFLYLRRQYELEHKEGRVISLEDLPSDPAA